MEVLQEYQSLIESVIRHTLTRYHPRPVSAKASPGFQHQARRSFSEGGKRVIQYSRDFCWSRKAAAYWIPRFRGV
jgi:hypothetical protein